ncbi:MAG: glycogen debranching N-terminal domain-containing protein [Vicinamibacterales bacterium]
METRVRSGLLYAWKGPSLLIVTPRGDCGSGEQLSGFYYREARFLQTCRLEVNGEPPWLCEAAAVAPDRLDFAYSYPEIAEYGGGGSGQSGDDEPVNAEGVPQRAIDVRVGYRVGLNHLTLLATFGNRARRALEFEAAWILEADFADIQEAQHAKRQQTAPVRAEGSAGRLEISYDHPRLHYRTSIALPREHQWQTSGGRAATRLVLDPGQTVDIQIRIAAIDQDGLLTGEDIAERARALERWQASFARVEAPGNRVFEDVLANNVRDVASFALAEGEPDEWLALQAGMPLYPALFGRDAVTAGWQAASVDQGASLDAALTRLGRMQSDRDHDWTDEEPGRIPYQVRRGPLALLELNPYAAYYADYASPLMYVISLANLFMWTGDEARVRRHWDTARRILDWARERGDLDHDGYLEYQTRSSAGTKNQGWKDSGDAIIYEDGSAVPPPIATCELQGYWFAAQQLFGLVSEMIGASGDGKAHLAAAHDLKVRFNRDWWIDAQQFFALAMDPDKRLIDAPSSNVGHCLASGIIDADHLPPAVGRLFAPDMFSGWGIRTLSSDHAYYNPLSYHRGSVWGVEQGTILFGLRRFGFDARVHDLASALFDLARLYPEYRIPECVGGYARGDYATPGAYPQSNTPQLWNATAFPLMVQTLLGLLPVAPLGTLMLDPILPPWLPDVVLHDLKVGQATVTLRAWRTKDGACDFDVVRKQGELRIVRQPPPESLSASLADRAGALVGSIFH